MRGCVLVEVSNGSVMICESVCVEYFSWRFGVAIRAKQEFQVLCSVSLLFFVLLWLILVIFLLVVCVV